MSLRSGRNLRIRLPRECPRYIQPVVIVTHYESTFNANSGRHFVWVYDFHNPSPKKGKGQGLHILDFLTPIGHFGSGVACKILKCGVDIWWDRAKLLEQIKEKPIPEFERDIPGCQVLFMFDNTKNHAKFTSDALRVTKMNLEDGGKNLLPMQTIFVIDNNHSDGGWNQLMLLDIGVL